MKMPAAAIREEIFQSGIISFARFMELALYCPETGYYEANKDTVGQRGDFITSVSAGPLFGRLLAFQFAEWLQAMPIETCRARRECLFPIIETGAHGGQLAGDILAWLQDHRPELFAQMEYVIAEPSFRRREWQQAGLAKYGEKVRWVSHLSELKNCRSADGIHAAFYREGPAEMENRQSPVANRQFLSGIIFSNELLDAFPIHRFGWDAKRREWYEWGVAVEGEHFRWAKINPPVGGPGFSLSAFPAALLEVLPDNYVVETSPAAETWWREAAGVLAHGKLLAIDYGYSAAEMLSPARLNGTLRAYHRHRVTDDVLASPGEQDLTAHVNFSAIQTAGESAGLRTEQFCTQPQFLTRILQQAVAKKEFAQMDPKQVRQFQTLTHPEHLGRAFRVLVQGR